jgi:PAS domain S-box-containing protein
VVKEPNDLEDLPEGDGVLIVSREGRILSASLQAERLLRTELGRGQALALKHLLGAKYLPQAELALRECLKSGVSRANLLAELRAASGRSRFLIYSVSPLYNEEEVITGAVLTFRDSTLSRSWTDWSGPSLGEREGLLDHLSQGVFTVNTALRLTSFNRKAEEITGLNRGEILGRHCWEVFQADRCKSGCPLKATLGDGLTRADQEVHLTRRAGGRVAVQVSTSVLKNKRDVIVGGMAFFTPLAAQARAPAEAPGVPVKVEIIGQSQAMRDLLALLPDVAASEAAVVLEGESGTGKDLLARAIHQQGPRSRGPFVAFSCSALVETLIESELFGHVKGSFTGAIQHKVGRFEMAKGGTLFLDEIGDLKPELQAKLLRVLEERSFERVGGTRPVPLEARVISATSRNLLQEVRQGRFRMDLLYRLRTVPLYLPPLRERPEDIPLLVSHFVARLNRSYKKEVRGVDPQVIHLFQQYSWPGNIRELERVLEYAFVFVKGPIITRSHLPELETSRRRAAAPAPEAPPDRSLWQDERLSIQKALQKARGRRQVAARLLGISRSSLWRKMKAHGLRG